jgi:1-acyl-sn-glycerol-3-phosphate acyltransferase
MESPTTRTRSRFGVPTTVLAAPWRCLTLPQLYGLENLPRDRPFLLVGNHTVMGLLDAPLMVLEIADRCGIELRSLGDHVHFRVPGWRTLLASWGTVEGDPDNCRALMRARESILVYPGGAREVFKRKGEKYQLIWGGRTGFARLAIEHRYPIVPFGAVGAEECYDILLDAGDVLATPLLGSLLRRLLSRADEIPPLVRGIGLTPLPRPQRFYFSFAPPIETTRFALASDLTVPALAVRELVRASIEAEIAFLFDERRRDPERALLPRLVHGIRGLVGVNGTEADRLPDASAPCYAGAGTTSGR